MDTLLASFFLDMDTNMGLNSAPTIEHLAQDMKGTISGAVHRSQAVHLISN